MLDLGIGEDRRLRDAETTHGFAVRPKLTHEPTKKAFDEAGESATEFFRKHLLNGK